MKTVNWLDIARRARVRCGMKLATFAAYLGISEPLASACLSDHEEAKHLSMRRMGGIEDANYCREFALLLLEDLGLSVIVLDKEQAEAFYDVQAASARFTQAMTR